MWHVGGEMSSEEARGIELSGGDPSLTVSNLRIPGEAVYEVYKPVESVQTVTVDDREFLRFATTGASGSLLLDVSSGRVVEIQTGSGVSLVNTSLESFIDCLEVFVEHLAHLESNDGDEEVDEEVASELEASILRIDPDAFSEGSFWYEVRWSVAIGDFSD
jgi:hypothetical protein